MFMEKVLIREIAGPATSRKIVIRIKYLLEGDQLWYQEAALALAYENHIRRRAAVSILPASRQGGFQG
jgi:hypothetical protein